MAVDRHAPARRVPPRRSAGFTLVEMLLALALTGALFVAIAGALSFGGQAIRTGARKVDDAEGLLLTYRMLHQAVGRAYAFPADEGIEPGIEFEGRRDGLHLIAFLPPYPDVAGAYAIEFRIESDASGLTELWLLRSRYRTERKTASQPLDRERFLIFRGNRTLTFSYFGPERDGSAEAAWQEAWQDRGQLPALVRLKFAADDGRDPWPDLALRPGAAATAICVQLPDLPLCQPKATF